jgi:hypothetical protein
MRVYDLAGDRNQYDVLHSKLQNQTLATLQWNVGSNQLYTAQDPRRRFTT